MSGLIVLTNLKHCDLFTVSGSVFLPSFNFFTVTSCICYAMQPLTSNRTTHIGDRFLQIPFLSLNSLSVHLHCL